MYVYGRAGARTANLYHVLLVRKEEKVAWLEKSLETKRGITSEPQPDCKHIITSHPRALEHGPAWVDHPDGRHTRRHADTQTCTHMHTHTHANANARMHTRMPKQT